MSKDAITIYLEIATANDANSDDDINARQKGNLPGIFIHNIYNEPGSLDNPGIAKLRQALNTANAYCTGRFAANYHPEHIIVGDFNIHDLIWSGSDPIPQNKQANNKEWAEQFKQIIEEIPLTIITPPGIKTQPTPLGMNKHGSTINLCLTSWELQDQIQHCRLVYNLLSILDYVPVETKINTNPVPSPPCSRGGTGSL
jgi:hypothetical protein